MSTALRGVVLGDPQRGTVLASMRLAAYVALDGCTEPSVVALVAPGAVRLPIALSVPRLPALAEGAPARVGHGVVTAGGHSWRPARWWEPVPRVDARALRTHGWRLGAVVAAQPAEAFGVDVEQAYAAVTALEEGNHAAASGLLGAGPGLTPAGDDVVSGAMAALALIGRLHPDAAAAITSAARSRTTALSAALLRAATHGQVVPEAARTLRALAGGEDIETLGRTAKDLFAVGATSGHDLALGIAAALRSAARVPAQEAT